jgi:hypothetical protein
MVSIVASIVPDLKVSSLYSTVQYGHNKWKKANKDDKNPTWRRILDAVLSSYPLLRRVCWPRLKNVMNLLGEHRYDGVYSYPTHVLQAIAQEASGEVSSERHHLPS